ncbi:MAG: T9SS type A sorting domain-containing protein [Crocinitomicaceae bacterium]
MKKTYLLLLSLLVGGVTFSQVVIHKDSDPAVVQNGQTINIDVDVYGYELKMHCLNTSGVSANYKFRRVIMSSSTTFTDQFCDNNLCYGTSGNDWTSPSPATVAAGDSSLMKPIFNFSDGGTASIRYYVLDADNGDDIIDSVDVNINSSVGFEDLDITLSAYPNPANDQFTIQLNGTNDAKLTVEFFNLIGEKVIVKNLSEGINKIDVDALKNGIYFYSILNGSEVVETKKLVVRH